MNRQNPEPNPENYRLAFQRARELEQKIAQIEKDRNDTKLQFEACGSSIRAINSEIENLEQRIQSERAIDFNANVSRQVLLRQRLNAFNMEAREARSKYEQLEILLENTKIVLQDTLHTCYASQIYLP